MKEPFKRMRARHELWKEKYPVDGEPRTARRTGLGDPRLRLSVSFFGAPALRGEKFRKFRTSHPVSTIAGAALAVTLPLGEYKEDKLLNFGNSRFVIRSQLGVVHTRGHWSYALTGSVLLYTDNNEFRSSQKSEQDTLFALQSHVIYSSMRG